MIEESKPGCSPLSRSRDVFDDFSNDEVRCALCWAHRFFNYPDRLKVDSPGIFGMWMDYRNRICKDMDDSGVMNCFNFWVMCYALKL